MTWSRRTLSGLYNSTDRIYKMKVIQAAKIIIFFIYLFVFFR